MMGRMARSQTSRFKLWRWSLDTDTQTRTDFDSSHAQIEALAAISLSGTRAARPAPGVRDRYYWAHDDLGGVGALYYDTGSAWVELVAGDSGERTVTAYPALFDPEPGWSLTGSTRVRRRNHVVTIDVVAIRTGATIAADVNNGNMLDTQVAVITDDAYQPNVTKAGSGYYNTPRGSHHANVFIGSGGNLVLGGGMPGVDFEGASASNLVASFTFLK